MDDNQLNKRICEESNESNDDYANVVYECCACHEAKFEVCFSKINLCKKVFIIIRLFFQLMIGNIYNESRYSNVI